MMLHNDRAYYQAKFEYYRDFNKWVIVAACLASLTYFISDCQLFGRFAAETLLPRFFILIPLCVFLSINKNVKDYRIIVPLSYAMVHSIMWCTIWAIRYLPDRSHANEGFLIVQFIFLVLGFGAPYHISTIAHVLFPVDILLSNLFNHYADLNLMLSLGIPLMVGIWIVNYVMETVYMDQYIAKLRLEQALVEDPLTKVYNRNKMDNLSDRDSQRLCLPGSENTGIMIMDVDFFKKVNDTYGHDAGDKVLVYVVNIAKQRLRSTDYIIRWGGEEFVMILPGCDQTQVMDIAERIRSAIESGNSGICPITVSIGVTRYMGGNYRDSVKNADTALYRAKEGGRNRVVCFESM